jgi:glycosyltransferase involved in cell wall biosynthesis
VISIITPTYNTKPDVLARTWASLKAQTYTDWEWVVYDDSPSLDVYRQVYGFCADERYKIRLFRPHVPSNGRIGYVKRTAFSLGLGDILVEVDHDDQLTPDCLQELATAFTDPAVGFVYSDCAEVYPDGTSHRYPDGWGLGHGEHYWDEQHQVWACRVPVNRTTLSHIVSAPNHVRAWRTSVYHSIGGHNPELRVADDYELIVRTALSTEIAHIPKMLYLQHIDPQSAQRAMNGLIQDLVPKIAETYASLLDEKFGASI